MGPAGHLETRQYDNNVPPHSEQRDSNARPPASRRAVSASGIGTLPSTDIHGISSGSGMARQTGWEPGMPLPPPPPGPPPAASRSQSASGVSDTSSSPSGERGPGSRTRHQSYAGSNLGPIPPTPAGWVDEDYAMLAAAAAKGERLPQLQVNTTTITHRPTPILVSGGGAVTSPAQVVSPPSNRNSTS